ncbi:MAG: hypothetical protein ACI90V_008211 [Bacillariaceae sp.]|jgi:hypothetical protein
MTILFEMAYEYFFFRIKYGNLIHFEISNNRSHGLRWTKRNLLLQIIRNKRSITKYNENIDPLYTPIGDNTKSSMDVESNE